MRVLVLGQGTMRPKSGSSRKLAEWSRMIPRSSPDLNWEDAAADGPIDFTVPKVFDYEVAAVYSP